MAKNVQTQEEKTKMNPILWFFFAIVIPLVVAIMITVIVLVIAGVDVAGWAKEKGSNIPLISSLLSDDEKGKGTQPANGLKINDSLKAKDKEISKLKDEISDLEGTVDDLEQQLIKQKNKETSDQNAQENVKSQTNNTGGSANAATSSQMTAKNDPVKKIATSFKKMDAQQAALIVEGLSNNMAVDLMNELSTDARGQILGAMDAKKAAALTERFIKANENKENQ